MPAMTPASSLWAATLAPVARESPCEPPYVIGVVMRDCYDRHLFRLDSQRFEPPQHYADASFGPGVYDQSALARRDDSYSRRDGSEL